MVKLLDMKLIDVMLQVFYCVIRYFDLRPYIDSCLDH